MYKNERVIHLGRNKTPLSHTKDQPSLSFKENQHFTPAGGQSIILGTHHQNMQECNINFPRASLQASEMFRGSSKSKNIYPADVIENSQINCNIQCVEVEKVGDLLRKVSILERIVKELHDEKQHQMARSHIQIQKLMTQNQMLRRRVSELETSHNYWVKIKTAKPGCYKQQTPAACQMQSPSFGLKNVTNEQWEQEDDGVSINYHLDHSKMERTKRCCCVELEKQNSSLKHQITQLFNRYIQSGAFNQVNLQDKQLSESVFHRLKLIDLNRDSQSRQIQARDVQIGQLKQQIDEYDQLLLKKSQLLIKTEETYKQKLSIATNEHKKQCSQLAQKAKNLMEELEQEKRQRGIEGKESGSVVCPKCKDFVKALVKLNQRVYTGGMVNY